MRIPFARIGGKRSLLKTILPKIPPHKIYCEVFVGGGAVYWKKQPSDIEIINDLETGLINAYKALKKPTSIDLKIYDTKDISKLQTFFDTKEKKGIPILVKYILVGATFGSTGKGKIYAKINAYNKLKNKKEYEERMKTTKIKNKSWEKMFKYDSKETFFYLDPPYENSKTLYDNYEIDYEEMASMLKKIKGKFLLSINDSKTIRNIFKDFKIYKINLTTPNQVSKKDKGQKNTSRKELLISNYSF